MARPPITKANPYRSKKYGKTFHTERHYRDFLAEKKGFRNWYQQQRAPFRARSEDEWSALHPVERDTHNRALNARNDMLHGLSKKRVLRKYHLTENAFHRHVGDSVERRAGRWVAKPGADPFRQARMLTSRGEHMVTPRNDAEASRIGAHWNAAKGYARAAGTDREAGALRALRSFDEDRVDGEAFMTDPDDVLDYFESSPESFESIYEEVAA